MSKLMKSKKKVYTHWTTLSDLLNRWSFQKPILPKYWPKFIPMTTYKLSHFLVIQWFVLTQCALSSTQHHCIFIFFPVYCLGLGFTEGSSLTWSSWIIFRIVVHLVSERRSLNTQVTGKKDDKLGLLYAYILFHLSHFHHILCLSRRIPPKKPGLLFIHSRILHRVQLVKGCPISYIRTRNCFNINILPLTIETVKVSWLKLTLFVSCCSYLHYCITHGNKYWSKSSRMEQNDSCCLSVHNKQLKTQILTPPAGTQCCIVKSRGLGIGSKQFNIDLAGEGEVFKLE